jgi:uncharacterized membrane protein
MNKIPNIANHNPMNKIQNIFNYKCSSTLRTITGFLHGIAIAIVIIFSGIQIYNIKKETQIHYWLPLSIAIMMVLRLPNIICVALNDSHGWFMVVGTIAALVTYSYITKISYDMSKKYRNKNLHPRKFKMNGFINLV